MQESINSYIAMLTLIGLIFGWFILIPIWALLAYFVPDSLRSYFFKWPFLSKKRVSNLDTPVGFFMRVIYISNALLRKNPRFPKLAENIKNVTPYWYILSLYLFIIGLLFVVISIPPGSFLVISYHLIEFIS